MAKHGDERLALVGAQKLNQIGEVGLVQRKRKLAHRLGVAGFERGFNGVQELGAKFPLLIAQRDLVCRVLHPALPIALS